MQLTMTTSKRKSTDDGNDEPKSKMSYQKARTLRKSKSSVNYESGKKKSKVGREMLQRTKGSSSDPQTEKKPNWEELKKRKKELRVMRRKRECFSGDTLNQAKQLWELVRRNKCKDRQNLTEKLHGLLKGNLSKVVFSHDMSRIIQWLLKLGTPKIREEIVEELKSHVADMMQSKYSSFCVKYMLKYSSKSLRKYIIHSCQGKVMKLMSHKIGSPVFEYMYSTWANSHDKALLRQELYGDLYVKQKDVDIHSLNDVLQKFPDMKESNLSSSKHNLIQILNKKMIKSSLLQTVMKEFLRHCSNEDREEIFALIRDDVLDIANAKDGVFVAMMFIWHATNKTKKQIMKQLKGRIVDVASSEHSHHFILALIDVVDDTTLFNKMLMPELVENLWTLATNEHGRKVILYLIAHRDNSYFSPEKLAVLKEGAQQSSCKKDPAMREAELLAAISGPLLESITNDITGWLKNPSIQMVTLAAMKSGKDPELEQAFEALAKHLCSPHTIISDNKDQNEQSSGSLSGIHMMLKNLIRHDKEKEKNKATFSLVLAGKLTTSKLKEWLSCNRSCYILVALMESEINPAVDIIRKKLAPLMRNQEIPHTKGWEILSSKFNATV